MNAADVIGYADTENGGPALCPQCATPEARKHWAPIFPTDEADSPTCCAQCEDLIPHALTTEGLHYVRAAILDYVGATIEARKAGKAGRRAILVQWWAEYRESILADIDHDLRARCAQCGEPEGSGALGTGRHLYGATMHDFVPAD